MRIGEFDALELHTVIPVEGGLEQITTADELIPGFQHGLYGHIPAPVGGIEWIADFDTAGEARMAAAEIAEGREIFDYLIEPAEG